MSRLLLILIITLALIACSDVSETNETADRRYPDQEIWNSAITLTKEGKKRAVVHSAHLTKYNDRNYVTMDRDVVVDFFDIEEGHRSRLTAQEAVVDEGTNDLTARKNVIVVSDSGLTLLTEELRWEHRRERILSEVFVTFISRGDTLTGYGFESDSDLKNWVIYKPAGVTDRPLRY